jgi:hypothetical protein
MDSQGTFLFGLQVVARISQQLGSHIMMDSFVSQLAQVTGGFQPLLQVQSNGFPHHVGCRAPANSQNSF